MNNIWFTSDTHFSHNKEFLYGPRGFTNVDDMNEAIIENWNKVVKPNDIVYHLGDTMLNDNEKGIECFKRLNGQIFLIWGNHDTENRTNALFEACRHKMLGGWYAWQVKPNNMLIYMSHYPTLTANFDQKKFSQHVLNVHGHTHQQKNFYDPTNPFMYHVGVDSHNCTPVHLDEIMADVKQRWYEVEKLPQTVKPEDIYPYNMIAGKETPLKIVFEGENFES